MRIVLLFFFMQCVPFAGKAQTVMQWCKQIRGVGFDGGYRIEVDSAGATYIAGNFTLNSDFDPGAAVFAMTSVSGSDGYILKLDMNGNFAWAGSIGGNGNSHVTDLKTDAPGKCIPGGHIRQYN